MHLAHLIVNADDFGMSRGITDGIIAAHRYGILSSTSIIPNMPAAEYALERLQKFPRLGVGVHLNICGGRPILPPDEIRSLVGPDGHFYPPRVMIRRLCTGRARGSDILAEFRAQILWLKDRGVVPTHADSHHHMHLYPAAVLPFVRALKSEGILCTRAPRCVLWTTVAPGTLAGRVGGPHEGPLARRAIVSAYRCIVQCGPFRGFHMPQGRISFTSRARHDLDTLGEQWLAAFHSPRPGTFELTCHPGFFEPGFSEGDAIHTQRERELQWLTSNELRDAIERSEIQLINYRDLVQQTVAQGAPNHAAVLQ